MINKIKIKSWEEMKNYKWHWEADETMEARVARFNDEPYALDSNTKSLIFTGCLLFVIFCFCIFFSNIHTNNDLIIDIQNIRKMLLGG